MAAKHSRNFVFIFLRFLTSLCIIHKYHRFESRIITRTTRARSFTPRDWLLGFYTRRFVPWTRKSEYFLVLTYSRLVSLQFVFFCRPPCNLPAIILIRAMNQSIFDLISFYNDTSVDVSFIIMNCTTKDFSGCVEISSVAERFDSPYLVFYWFPRVTQFCLFHQFRLIIPRFPNCDKLNSSGCEFIRKLINECNELLCKSRVIRTAEGATTRRGTFLIWYTLIAPSSFPLFLLYKLLLLFFESIKRKISSIYFFFPLTRNNYKIIHAV